MFEADRDAQQALRRARVLSFHRGAMLDERLRTAKARRAGDEPERVDDRKRLLAAAADVERQHRAGLAHLPARHRIAGIGLKSRIVDAIDGGMRGEIGRHLLRALDVAAHPVRQRPQPAQNQPAVKRRRHGAQQRLDGPDALEEAVHRPRDDGAAEHVGVTAEVLRRRVHDDVDAQLQRPLQHRRRPCVVDSRARADGLGQRHHRDDVGDVQTRVGRRLDPESTAWTAGARASPHRGRSCPRTCARGPIARTGRGASPACRSRRPRARSRARRARAPRRSPPSRQNPMRRRPCRRRPRAPSAPPRAPGASGCPSGCS